MGRNKRSKRGSAITETGPSLLLFFMLVFFPLMDVLYMGCGYAFAWFLHTTEIRELSVNDPATANTTLTKADNDFFTNAAGMANFLHITLASDVTHDAPQFTMVTERDPNDQTQTRQRASAVTLTTRVRIKPWLYIALVPNVPGLSADVPLRFTTTKPQEESATNG